MIFPDISEFGKCKFLRDEVFLPGDRVAEVAFTAMVEYKLLDDGLPSRYEAFEMYAVYVDTIRVYDGVGEPVDATDDDRDAAIKWLITHEPQQLDFALEFERSE